MHSASGTAHLYHHRVSYGETDAMKVLYYAEYLHIFERARSAYIRERGLSYSTVEERGLYLPVREATCRYRTPARYDDLLEIRTVISELGRASLVFAYEVYNEAGTLITTGLTEHACVGPEGKPVRLPAWFAEICRGGKKQ